MGSSQVVFELWPVLTPYVRSTTSVMESARELTVSQVGPGFGINFELWDVKGSGLALRFATSVDSSQCWITGMHESPIATMKFMRNHPPETNSGFTWTVLSARCLDALPDLFEGGYTLNGQLGLCQQ